MLEIKLNFVIEFSVFKESRGTLIDANYLGSLKGYIIVDEVM